MGGGKEPLPSPKDSIRRKKFQHRHTTITTTNHHATIILTTPVVLLFSSAVCYHNGKFNAVSSEEEVVHEPGCVIVVGEGVRPE